MRPKLLLASIFFILLGRPLFASVAPTISAFSPAQGPIGTLVTVAGTNLGGPTSFSIGGVTAIVISNTGTRLVGLVMPGALTGVVSLSTSGGVANSANKFTVTPTSYPHVQQGAPLIGTNGLGQPYQGNSVAISADGNTAVVAGYNDNSNQGAGWFYTRAGGVWTQQGAKVIAADHSVGFGAYFGTSVSISADGNTAAFGGPDDHTGTGAIFVFTRTAGVWTQQGAKLVGTGAIANNGNPEGNAQQGFAVALSADGNTLLEGGWFDNGGIGAVWAFTRTAGVWTQQGNKIVASNITGNGYFGRAVSLSADGNTAAIDGPADNTVWFYTRSGGTWTQGSQLTGTGGFGFPVALSADGSTAIMGATGDNSPLGAAWIYTRSGNTWPPANGIKLVGTGGSNSGFGSTQGSAVSLSADGNTAVIGGNTDGGNAGAIWVFTRSGTTWTQQGNKFNATGAGISSGAQNGSSAALSADGTTLIEGAPQNNTNYGFAAAFTPILPSATTQAATNITATGANLNGLLSANGIEANVSFEYGMAADLTGSTVTTTFVAGSNPLAANAGNVSFASNLTGLTPSTTYYFRVDASNVNGAVYGNILNFTTPSAPPPPPVITFTSPGTVVYGSITTPIASSTDKTQPILFFSHNTAVATITSNGKFQAAGVGTASLTAFQYAQGTQTIEAAADANITVVQAPLTITPDNKSVAYGQPIPPLTATYTGLVNGDTPASFSQQVVLATQAQQGYGAGTYNIYVGQNPVDPNYNFTSVFGTLTITSAFPVPSATTVTQTNVTATGATLNGTANGNGADATVILQYTTDYQDGSLANLITATLTTGTSPLSGNAGTTNYAAILTGLLPNTKYYFIITAANSEYSTTGNILSFTTPPLPADQITFPQPAPVVYGSSDVNPGATSTNISVPITYTSSNTAVATITGGGQIHVAGVGTTNITAAQTATSITPVTRTFTVTPAQLTVRAHNETKIYGTVNPLLAYQYSGFVNGDDSTRLNPQAVISTTATTSSGVGNYPITVSGAADPNYTITYIPATLAITQAALTITADDKTKTQNSANPQLTVTYTGFVNEDGPGSLATPPQVGTTANSASIPGAYPITVTGAVDPNYTITYINGTLTVNPALVFNPIPPKTYGDPDFDPGATGTNITYTSSKTNIATIVDGKAHITGAGTTVITATSGQTSLQQTLVVNPASLTITVDDQTKTYGAANPALTVTYSGFVYNDNAASLATQPTVQTTGALNSPVGTYPITASGAADLNYTITYVAATLTITRAQQTISFATIPNQKVGEKYDLNGVTASSGLPVTFKLSDQAVASLAGTVLTALQPGTETVTASQAGNDNYLAAADQDQTYMVADTTSDELIVNQVVSPNGDGIDDVLNIKGIEKYPDNKLILVNRNGIKIFEMTNYNNTSRAFDGHSNITGVFQQQGTLLYMLQYTVNGQTKYKTGFTVLRY